MSTYRGVGSVERAQADAAGDNVEHSAAVDLARFRSGTARRRTNGEHR